MLATTKEEAPLDAHSTVVKQAAGMLTYYANSSRCQFKAKTRTMVKANSSRSRSINIFATKNVNADKYKLNQMIP